MRKLKAGDKVKWVDGETVYFGEIDSLASKTALVTRLDDIFIQKRIPLSKLVYLPPIKLSREEYRGLVRMEIDVSVLLEGNSSANVCNAQNYEFTVSDLLAAIEKLNLGTVEDNIRRLWFECIESELWAQINGAEAGFYTGKDVLRSLRASLYTPRLGYSAAIAEGRIYLEDRDKPVAERRYPRYVIEGLLERLESEAEREAASEEEKKLYRIFSESAE